LLKGKLSDFEAEFEGACKTVFLLQGDILTISDQIQKMNGGGGVALYPLPMFCNPIVLAKRSCDLTTCRLCGLWFGFNNFLATICGHTFHPWCVATHPIFSLKYHVVGCDFSFTRLWYVAWGIRSPSTEWQYWQ
jgi:hypothetical protein